MSIASFKLKVDELHLLVQEMLQSRNSRIHRSRSQGKLSNYAQEDFVLVARDDFTAGEKLSLRCRGPRRAVKTLNDCVYQVEDLWIGRVDDVHATRLKFHHDPSLNQEAIVSHVLSSETDMAVQGLMRLVDTDDGPVVSARWRELPETEDTMESIKTVYKDVSDLFMKPLNCKSTLGKLVELALRELYFWRRGV